MPFVPKAQGGSFMPKEDDKNFGEKTADFLGFTAFGKGLATLGVDRKQLDRDRELASQVQSAALAQRKANARAGKDTSRLDAALQGSLETQRKTDAIQRSIETGGGLSNREVIGSAINVAASLPAGFGGITAAKTSFRPLAKGAITGTLANQGLKAGLKKALPMLAAEGAVAGGLGGLGFGLMDKEKDALGVAGSALGGAVTGSILAPVIGLAATPVARAIGRAGNPAIRAAERQAKLDKLVGAVSQGKTQQEIDAAKAAYGAIDTEGVQSFTDLKDRLDDQIAETANGLDEVLATNPTRKTLDTFTAKVKVGDETVEYNYVDDAFAQLEDFYIKTNDVPGQTRLAQKRARAESEGLTIKEVNDLAKEHSANLNAYNANGQLASGLSKQAAENTRKGLKATARQEFNDPLYNAADAEISNLIKARDAAEAMMKEVQKLQNKIKDRSLGERAGRLGFQLLDLFTLRGLSGFTQAALGRGTGLKTFNALDLEKQLQKNLKEVQKILDKDAPEASIVNELERYIQRQSQSALPISHVNTSNAASTAKNVPIQAGIPQAIPPVNPRPVDSMLPSAGVPIRDADAVRLPVARQMDVVDESVPGAVIPEIRRSPEELPVIDAGTGNLRRDNTLPVIDATPAKPKTMLPPGGTKLYGSALGITPETDEQGNVTGVGYNPALGVAGLAGGKIASDALNNPAAVKKAFEGFTDLSTKLLEKLKGRSSVSRQFISDLTNSPDLKQTEKDLIRRILDEDAPSTGMTVYRGGEKFDSSKVKASGKGVGAYFTTDESFAKGFSDELAEGKYGKKGEVGVDSFDIPSNAKVIKREDLPKQFLNSYEGGQIEGLEDIKKFGSPQGLQDAVATWARKNGYDAVDYSSEPGKNIIVVNPAILRETGSTLNAGAGIKTSDQIDVPTFAEKVKAELLPLTVNRDEFVNGGPRAKSFQYESVNLPDELRGPVANYDEKIYQSPVKTSAGNVHFSGRDAENYFGHTRVEDLPDNGTRRVIEVQSDLFQKGRLEMEMPTEAATQISRLEREALEYVSRGEYTQAQADEIVKRGRENITKKVEDEKKGLSRLDPYKNNAAHFRMIREEVKQAAKDGKTKLQFPTGETAMKIEGLGDTTRWTMDAPWAGHGNTTRVKSPDLEVGLEVWAGGHRNNDAWIITDVLGDGKFKAVSKGNYFSADELAPEIDKTVSQLKKMSDEELRSMDFARITDDTYYTPSFEEQFDISGKVDTENPIYKFYEKEVGKYLKNKYGAELITDPQGVKWWQINVGKEQAKMPVEAFVGLGAVGLGTAATTPLGTNKSKEKK